MEVGVVSKKQEGVSCNFSELPEGCIASIFAITDPSPAEACRLALISRVCKSAAESDVIWERFLPSDLDLIVARSEEGEALLNEFPTKKQLYMRLADRPLLIDGATKSFWLEKSSGSKCLMLGARSLSIAWSDTPKHWRWASIPESRFPEVAQLVTIRQLEIRGKIKTSILSPDEDYYLAYLVFKTTEDAHGLENESLSFVNNEYKWPISLIPWHSRPGTRSRRQMLREFPEERSDGWKEVYIGDVSTHLGEEGEVELSVLDWEVEDEDEVEYEDWKGGVIIEGIELRPPGG